ncbi:hypothetical protein ES703_31675 [subsurface metagenome]
MSKQSKIKRVKCGMAARQLFLTEDFNDSLRVAMGENGNLRASGSNCVALRRDFIFENPKLDGKIEGIYVFFESPEDPITYDLLRRDRPHFPNFEPHYNINRFLLLSGVDGEMSGYWINRVPNSEIPDHYCTSPPARFFEMT